MTITDIEQELKTGQVPPPRLAEMRDFMAATSSEIMDEQDTLHDLYAAWFHSHRDAYKSDKAADNAWDITLEGKRQRQLETMQKKIKLLIGAVSSHLRVASDIARNMY